MKFFRKMTGILLAAAMFFMTCAVPANAADGRLSVTWAVLFPIPLPLPVWDVAHPDSFVTIGFLFPFWLPLPVYNYDDRGPVFQRMGGMDGVTVTEDTAVFIDGVAAGSASAFTDDSAFASLPDGTHTLELKDSGRTIYAGTFGVSDGVVSAGQPVTAD